MIGGRICRNTAVVLATAAAVSHVSGTPGRHGPPARVFRLADAGVATGVWQYRLTAVHPV